MDAKEFYEEFKHALDAIGVGFRGMANSNVKIEENRFTVSNNNSGEQFSFFVDMKEKQ